MSGPKCGSYHVVSAEEARRQRLAAARSRYERLAAARAEIETSVAAARDTYSNIVIAMPGYARPSGDDPATWEAAADRLSTTTGSLRDSLAAAVCRARTMHLADAASAVTAALVEKPTLPRRTRQQEETRTQELTRVLERLPGDLPTEIVNRCEALTRAWHGAEGETSRDRVLTQLRYLVQHAVDGQKRIERNRVVIEHLYSELDGLEGQPVERTRGLLKGLDLREPLPDGLEQRVEDARDSAREERDRGFVLSAASRALASLGYDVGSDFETLVVSDGALLNLRTSSVHALRIRERNHQLLWNVVRFGDSVRSSHTDASVEDSWCRDFSALRDRLRRDGIELELTRAEAPGTVPMQVLPRAIRRDLGTRQDAHADQEKDRLL